jgi:hypothetical protein
LSESRLKELRATIHGDLQPPFAATLFEVAFSSYPLFVDMPDPLKPLRAAGVSDEATFITK